MRYRILVWVDDDGQVLSSSSELYDDGHSRVAAEVRGDALGSSVEDEARIALIRCTDLHRELESARLF